MERSENFTLVTSGAEETRQFGRSFGKRVGTALCVSLVGSLGAGKTIMAEGICGGLDVTEDVLSPTFILYEEFDGRLPVIHLDLYRLEHESEIEDLGVFDKIGTDCVILVEWGDRSESIFSASDVVMHIEYMAESQRRITVSYCAETAAEVFKDRSTWSF